MPKLGKRYKKNLAVVEQGKKLLLDNAFDVLAKFEGGKFDESVEVAIKLGVDPRHADQQVRGAVVLPNGTGRKTRVLVFCRGPKEKEALDAGADFAGSAEFIEKVKGGWLDFDKVVATPDMMGEVGKIGKILGPRGLMPNPKVGTVTLEVAKAVKDLKSGKVEYRVDKAGIVHTILGKKSFKPEQLKANFQTLLESVQKAKPSAAKGTYIQSVYVSTTHSPSVGMDVAQFVK